jgi:hypothetical protein
LRRRANETEYVPDSSGNLGNVGLSGIAGMKTALSNGDRPGAITHCSGLTYRLVEALDDKGRCGSISGEVGRTDSTGPSGREDATLVGGRETQVVC